MHWFVHFQDKEAYGRVLWLEPVVWRDNWPALQGLRRVFHPASGQIFAMLVSLKK